ncbi:MAG: hypothetical protein M1569_03355 [Candidatus Marsarchaeota archaeon]|nr:hypothetical protein [Candidatus Marsarchaeota archaeon]
MKSGGMLVVSGEVDLGPQLGFNDRQLAAALVLKAGFDKGTMTSSPP